MCIPNGLRTRAIVALIALAAGHVVAQNLYQGADGGDWAVPGNWSYGWIPGFNPQAGWENARIDNALSVVLDTDVSWVDEGDEVRPTVRDVYVRDGASLTIETGGYLWINSTAWNNGWLRIGDSGDAGTVTIEGGQLDVDGGTIGDGTLNLVDGMIEKRGVNNGRAFHVGNRGGRTGTLNVSGGTFYNSNRGLTVATSANATGVVTQTGGLISKSSNADTGWGTAAGSLATFTMTGGSNYFAYIDMATDVAAEARFDISGGDFVWGQVLHVGAAGTATLRVSGGTLTHSRHDPFGSTMGFGWRNWLIIGNPDGTGSGLVEIVGDAATIEVLAQQSAFEGLLHLHANGTLRYVIDGSTVTGILVWNAPSNNAAHTVELHGTIDLVLDNYEPPIGHTYDLITGRTINDNGFALSTESAEVWELAIVGDPHPDETGQTLVATYTGPPPPPGSLFLLR